MLAREVVWLAVLGLPASAGVTATLWASALGTLLLGIFPSVLLNFVSASSSLIK